MPINSYKDDIELNRRRVEAWWQGEIVDRAVIQVTAPKASTRTASCAWPTMSPGWRTAPS